MEKYDDLISRRAAYDELFDMCNVVKKCAQVANDDTSKAIIEAYKNTLIEIKTRIAKLPSIHPEPLTDSEQRIFLAAMSREEKVCKNIDETLPGPCNLFKTCKEIERKVKKALWTN